MNSIPQILQSMPRADTSRDTFHRLDSEALSGSLGAVYRRARALAKLREALVEALPEQERRHFVGVSGSKRRLVIFADSPAWATRLRYCSPDLETAAARHVGVRPNLVFRVAVEHGVPLPPPRSPWLPERVVNTLESSARTVKDEGLAAALRRLARGGSD